MASLDLQEPTTIKLVDDECLNLEGVQVASPLVSLCAKYFFWIRFVLFLLVSAKSLCR